MKRSLLLLFCVLASRLLQAQCTPTITVSSSSICSGQTTTLTVSGGTTYTWSPGGANTSTIAVTPNSTTTYTLSATTGTCVASTSAQVSVTPTPTLMIVANPASICQGGTATLTAGSATTYTWSANAGGATTNTVAVSPSSNTVYTVTGSNGGCVASRTVSVLVSSNPTITVTSGTICAGGSATLTASGATTYTWSPATGLSSTTGSAVVASPSSTAVYTVTGSIGSCSAAATTIVTVNPNPVVTASCNGPLCVNQTINLVASTGSGAGYSWSGPNSFSSVQQSLSISGATTAMAGTYTVDATDANGCVGTATTNVVVNPLPVVTATGDTVCFNAIINLSCSPGGGAAYSWNGPNGYVSAQQNPTIINANFSYAGSYIVTVTDLNGCVGGASTGVLVNPLPTIAVNSLDLCAGNAGTLTASGAAGYSWSPSTALSSTTGAVVSANPTVSSTYTVVGTDANGCQNYAVSTVSINAVPTVTFTLQPDTAPHVWDVYPTYGAGYTASWNWGDGTSASGLYPSHTYSVAGTYSICVSVTDSNGCVTTACQNDSVYRSASSAMIQVNVINTATGMQNINIGIAQMKLYPNPANGDLFVRSASEIRAISICNSLGEIVMSGNYSGDVANIDISTLREGIYFVRVQTRTSTYTQKILVQH